MLARICRSAGLLSSLANPHHFVALACSQRYFGESYPVKTFTPKDIKEQLTLRQTLQDVVAIIQAKQESLGCGPRGTPTYCPVLCNGGSYSGFLATLIRMSYPDVVDIGYGAGNPLLLYDHKTTPYKYYEHITKVAEQMSPGCPNAVHESLAALKSDLELTAFTPLDLAAKAQEYGVCPNLPKKMKKGADLAEAIIHFTSSKFAEYNMWYYPPSPEAVFAKGCSVFQSQEQSVQERVKSFFQLMDKSSRKCHNFSSPEDGDDEDDLWNAVCCYIVPQIGKSSETMWFPEKYSLKKDINFCKKKYDIDVDLEYMDKEFGLGNLTGVTRLLLTNGLNDGWYAVSQTDPIPGSGIEIMNFKSGAHHSELMHNLVADTPEIALAHLEISKLVGRWLKEVQEGGETS
jgi:Serine carboxypeptidase S28